MKFLRSFWFLGGLALIINLGMMGFFFMRYQQKLLEPSKPAVAKVGANEEEGSIYWGFRTGEVENLAAELRQEKTAVERRERELQAIEARIRAEKEEVERLRAEVERLSDSFSEQIIVVQASELKNLKNLSNTYSSLNPQAAVDIFVEMDDALSAKILSMMKPEVVAAIFEEMAKSSGKKGASAKRAADLSERLRLQLIQKQK